MIASILALVVLMAVCTWIEFTYPEDHRDREISCFHCYDDDVDCRR